MSIPGIIVSYPMAITANGYVGLVAKPSEEFYLIDLDAEPPALFDYTVNVSTGGEDIVK